jgi:YD repeat-containing protein
VSAEPSECWQYTPSWGLAPRHFLSHIKRPHSQPFPRTPDPNGQTTTYTYNSAGDLHQLTDPLGHTTTWTWTPHSTDSWDVKECDPAGYCNEVLTNWLSGLPATSPTRPTSRPSSTMTRCSGSR